MLYHLSFYLKDFFFGFNVFKYITFRSFLAIMLAFFLTLLLTPIFLKKLKALQRLFKGYVREYTPEGHTVKKLVPNMGGLVILISVLLSSLLLMRLDLAYFWVISFCILGFGLIGLWDDYTKLKNKRVYPQRLSSLPRFLWHPLQPLPSINLRRWAQSFTFLFLRTFR
jgi:Phospho-N-acetylmuramoyl-pentapeptide-transferase (EC 2.7.8.13)